MVSRGAPAGGPAAARPPGVVRAGEGCESIPSLCRRCRWGGGGGCRSSSAAVDGARTRCSACRDSAFHRRLQHGAQREPFPSPLPQGVPRVPGWIGTAAGARPRHQVQGAAVPSRVCGGRLHWDARAGAAVNREHRPCICVLRMCSLLAGTPRDGMLPKTLAAGCGSGGRGAREGGAGDTVVWIDAGYAHGSRGARFVRRSQRRRKQPSGDCGRSPEVLRSSRLWRHVNVVQDTPVKLAIVMKVIGRTGSRGQVSPIKDQRQRQAQHREESGQTHGTARSPRTPALAAHAFSCTLPTRTCGSGGEQLRGGDAAARGAHRC